MRRVYTDTSAIACLLKAEPHTHAMRLWLEAGECEVVSSDLLEIELRRLAVRLGRPQGEVTLILRGISLAELNRATLRSASMLPHAVPSNVGCDPSAGRAGLGGRCDAHL